MPHILKRLKIWGAILKAALVWYVLAPVAVLGVFDAVWRFVLSDEHKSVLQENIPGLPSGWPWQGTIMLVLALVVLALLEKAYRLVEDKDLEVERARRKRPDIKIRPQSTTSHIGFRDETLDLDKKSSGAFLINARNVGSEDAVDVRIMFSIPDLNLRECFDGGSSFRHVLENDCVNVFTRIELPNGGSWQRFQLSAEGERRLDSLQRGESAEIDLPAPTKCGLILYMQDQAIKASEAQRKSLQAESSLSDLINRPTDVKAHREYFERRQREALVQLPAIKVEVSYGDHSGEVFNEAYELRSIFSPIGGIGYAWQEEEDKVALVLHPSGGLVCFEDEQNPRDGMYHQWATLLGLDK